MRLLKFGKPALATVPDLPTTADFSTESTAFGADGALAVLYWPAYSNPYQRLFYGRAADQYYAEPGDAEAALSAVRANPRGGICFHIHWLNRLFRDAQQSGDPAGHLAAFLAICDQIRAGGGKIAWTMHNLIEHESIDEAAERRFRSDLAQRADTVIVHGDRAAHAAVAEFETPQDRVLNVPHGSYIGVYPNKVTQTEAQRALGLTDAETVFANVGQVRPYKGLNALVRAVLTIEGEGARAKLVIAGNANADQRAALAEATGASRDIVTSLDRVPDDRLQIYLNAADFIVLPYRAILTSGSAILAFSFARPVIAPAIGALPELVQDGVNGLLYDPADAEGLANALRRAAATPAATRADMNAAAFRSATQLRWRDARLPFVRALACHPDS